MTVVLLALAGCAVLGGGGNGKKKDAVECDSECPVGTRRIAASSSLEVEGTFAWAGTSECEAFCEPEVACAAPNLPMVSREGGQDVFKCQAVEGFVSEIPPIDEVDVDFGDDFSVLRAPVQSTLSPAMMLEGLYDLDGDGMDDLVGFEPATWKVWHATSNGDGSFTILNSSDPLAEQPDTFIPTDLDGDGVMDILGSREDWGVGRWACWWRGVGDGTYLPLEDLSANTSLSDMRAADLDGDGDLDFLLVQDLDPGTAMQVYFGHGDATFEAPVQLTLAEDNMQGYAIGDFDGDGLLDLATSDAGGSLYRQSPARSFTLQASGFRDDLTGGQSTPLLVDLDDDGRDDWVWSVWADQCPYGSCIQAALSLPSGDFEDLEPRPGDLPGYGTAWRGPFDFDGDGIGDFSAPDVAPVLIVPRGSTPYRVDRPFPTVEVGSFEAGDIDGDGIDELVGTGPLGGSSVDVEVQWL